MLRDKNYFKREIRRIAKQENIDIDYILTSKDNDAFTLLFDTLDWHKVGSDGILFYPSNFVECGEDYLTINCRITGFEYVIIVDGDYYIPSTLDELCESIVSLNNQVNNIKGRLNCL